MHAVLTMKAALHTYSARWRIAPTWRRSRRRHIHSLEVASLRFINRVRRGRL